MNLIFTRVNRKIYIRIESHLLHVCPLFFNRSRNAETSYWPQARASQPPKKKKLLSIAQNIPKRARNKCTKINSGQLYEKFFVIHCLAWACATYALCGCMVELKSIPVSRYIKVVCQCSHLDCNLSNTLPFQAWFSMNTTYYCCPTSIVAADGCAGHIFHAQHFCTAKIWGKKCHRKDRNALSGKSLWYLLIVAATSLRRTHLRYRVREYSNTWASV